MIEGIIPDQVDAYCTIPERSAGGFQADSKVDQNTRYQETEPEFQLRCLEEFSVLRLCHS